MTISANVTERIQSLSIRDGAAVAKGQVLAVLAQGRKTQSLPRAAPNCAKHRRNSSA
ncbi:biotin/lipoyl-binding protein [Hankyongella ginsenosidimutans]|uniref:biotin/lipoyl-binding protein n=1 Tax=Hankyongella ginsenosidimutans TaxID=1763828 RepID=UPI001FE45141|nr:biotin/lipoyl-binding protein [Hankyongella ginsenosidimutans]